MKNSALKILIVDDEVHASALLQRILENMPEFDIIGTANSAKEAKTILTVSHVDVILLDIEMPSEDGFNLISYLRSKSYYPGIIIISAFEKYALKAIKNSVFDYHLKPVSKNDLLASLRKYKSMEQKSSYQSLEQISRLLQNDKKRMKLPDSEGYQIIDPAEVLFIEGDGNYSDFILKNGSTLCISKNIGSIEDDLPDNFIRVSRKHIVNVDHILRIRKKSGKTFASIESGYDINISRGYKSLVELELARFFL